MKNPNKKQIVQTNGYGKSNFIHKTVSKRFSKLFASMVFIIGLIVLVGWYSKSMLLTRCSINEVPMAPSTAYIFIALAAGLWFYTPPQKLVLDRNIAIFCSILTICISFLLVITNLFNYYSNWEYPFIEISGKNLGFKPGNMSIITAIVFIINGCALLFLQSSRKIFKTFSIILTLIIFIISFILLLAYGFGVPFFYFDNFIPPAVLTVLSFLLISLALIAASNKNTFLVKTIWNTSTSAKLLRIFLPTTISIIVVESLIAIRILPLFNIHPAFAVSLVSLIVIAIMIIVISIISKNMGKSLDTALKDLSESEEKSRNLIKKMMNAFALHELIYNKEGKAIDYKFLQVNPAWEKIVGIKSDMVIGKTLSEIMPEIDKFWIDLYSKIVETGISEEFEKHSIAMKKYFYCYAYRTEPGKFAVIFNDITDKKKAAKALLESENRFKALHNASFGGISIHDKGTIMECNQGLAEMTGYSRAELIGMDGLLLIAKKSRKDVMDKTISNYEKSYESIGLRKNGEEYILRLETRNIPYKGKTARTVEFRDITDRRLIETEIKNLNNELEERVKNRTFQLESANKELETFSYSVSHDLRAPLRHINGFIDLFTKRFTDSIPEKGLHYLTNISDSATKMGILIDDLLNLSRTGRKKITKTNIDMNINLEEVLTSIKEEIPNRKIEWIISPLPNIYGDYSFIKLVWYNLLSNAVKFTQKKEKSKIEIGFEKNDNDYVFFVRDNGAGFDMKYGHKLFGVFQRLHSIKDYEGTGIGLANVKRIINKHGGNIWAEAEVNKGATFYFTLNDKKDNDE